MTIRNWLFLFFTTLSLGAVTAPLFGWLLELPFGDLGLSLPQRLLGGLMFGAVAQMGFFAYLIFNWVGAGFFRRPVWFQTIQVLLLLLVVGEVVFFGSVADRQGRFLAPQAVVALITLLVGLAVAAWKAKLTHRRGFVPTLFFMVVATLIEAGSALKQGSLVMMLFMVLTLLVCNAWQVLLLHRLVAPPKPVEGKSGRTRGEVRR